MQREAPAPPSPLALKPAVSQRRALEHLAECSQVDLLEQLKELKVQRWERCVASSWHPVLNRFDNILAAFADPSQRAADGAPDEELVCEVLRVLHDIVFLHQELKGAVDRLRDLLQCSELKVLLGALRCLAACPPSRYLQSSPLAAAMERRLEVLACCGAPSVLGSTGFRDACSSEDSELADFEFEIPESAVGNPASEELAHLESGPTATAGMAGAHVQWLLLLLMIMRGAGGGAGIKLTIIVVIRLVFVPSSLLCLLLATVIIILVCIILGNRAVGVLCVLMGYDWKLTFWIMSGRKFDTRGRCRLRKWSV
ncbi:UPL2 [Symbiodinium sp. CCMP2592]|nr:UPL2 [Symbiodinium sp. CCMP2592]